MNCQHIMQTVDGSNAHKALGRSSSSPAKVNKFNKSLGDPNMKKLHKIHIFM